MLATIVHDAGTSKETPTDKTVNGFPCQRYFSTTCVVAPHGLRFVVGKLSKEVIGSPVVVLLLVCPPGSGYRSSGTA